jgi:DNA polymerase bacteriophage-type
VTVLFLDLETRSAVDLKKHGSFVYYESPTTDVLMARYAFDDGPVLGWRREDPCPEDLREHILAGGTVSGWNVFSFERLALENVLHTRYGWPVPRLEQYEDTMHQSVAMSLPRALGDAAEALGLDVQKDKTGAALIRKFSVPRRVRKDEDPSGVYFNEPEDFPDDFEAFWRYCGIDVETERAAKKRLMPLSAFERAVTVMDARINSKGVRIDRTSAQAAMRAADKAKKLLDREMRIVTGGYVTACSQPGKLVEWVASQGVTLSSAAKAEITELLEADDLPANVRKALELRQEAAKTSVAKLKSMLDRAGADGRVRGAFMYHGASTGRWVSTGVNLANLPRHRQIFEEHHPRTDVLFKAFRTEDPELLPFLYGDELGRPLHLISDAIRGFLWAAPGHEFVQADYSNIEGNVLAWLAGEEWKLEAVREINADPQKYPDMYRRAAAAILGLTTDIVTKKHWARQAVGKPAELGLGFGGGPMAFVTFAKGYGVKLDPLAPSILEQADEERIAKATKRYEGQLKLGKSGTDVLSRDAWIACHTVVQGWRAQNAMIAKSWRDAEAAVRDAVFSPGQVFSAARTDFLVRQGFLWARLPSGRCLAYGAPRLKAQVWAKVRLGPSEWSDAEVMERDSAERGERLGDIKIEGPTSDKVTVLGVNSATRKWHRYALYSGLIVENLTQAIARDILVNGMWKAEGAGYPIIATVYDEIIAEVPRGFGSVSDFERLICELPEWAAGLPLTAGGWRKKRYAKE